MYELPTINKMNKKKFDYFFHSSVVNQSLLSNHLVIRYTRKLQDIVLKDYIHFNISVGEKRKHGFELLDAKTNFNDHSNTTAKIKQNIIISDK